MKLNGNNIYLPSDNKGFAIIAALLAILVLTAVGALVFTITTKDVRVSMRVVGEKKAFSAAQAGIHDLVRNSNANAGIIANYTPSEVQVDPSADPETIFTIVNSNIAGVPPSIPMSGYEIGGYAGSKHWGQAITNKGVTGANRSFKSSVTIDVGIGYGPIEISTGQPAAGG